MVSYADNPEQAGEAVDERIWKMSPVILREIFAYDPETGVLTHRRRSPGWFSNSRAMNAWNARFAGEVAGSVGGKGYLQVTARGRVMQGHRVAWVIATGEEPDQIDHINGDKTDNRLANLRSVTHQENSRNLKRSSNNSSGVTGVSWNSRLKKWQARIKNAGRSKSLGYFHNLADAAAARKVAEAAYGFHENHGLER